MIAICQTCTDRRAAPRFSSHGLTGIRYPREGTRQDYRCPDCLGELRALKPGETYGLVLPATKVPA